LHVIMLPALRWQGRCSTAVSNAYGDCRTIRMTAVSNAAHGRRTINLTL
ncbi:MAG: hypothetical protein HXL34_06850, partial [Prevotellaceae bacterium]|nr:hypothetical protein [Prevotellaceae bacterium]